MDKIMHVRITLSKELTYIQRLVIGGRFRDSSSLALLDTYVWLELLGITKYAAMLTREHNRKTQMTDKPDIWYIVCSCLSGHTWKLKACGWDQQDYRRHEPRSWAVWDCCLEIARASRTQDLLVQTPATTYIQQLFLPLFENFLLPALATLRNGWTGA